MLISVTRSATSSPSSRSASGTVSLGIFTTSTSRLHLTFAITVSLYRASTSTSQPMSSHGQKASLAYSASPVPPHASARTDLRACSGNLMKPTLDLILFTSQLSRSLGFRGTFLLFGNYYLTIKVCLGPLFLRIYGLSDVWPRSCKQSRRPLVVLLPLRLV